jgi:Zn-dependent peptidase ImmA (M78 family)
MNETKKREISSLAQVVRDSLELETPIDVFDAVTKLGGTLRTMAGDFGEPEALVRRTEERFEIWLKNAHSPLRQRFSVAHELGHLFLHMGYLLKPETWARSDEYKDSVYHRYGFGVEEIEANLFAAALLMPEREFRINAEYLSHLDSSALLKSLSRHFKTSAAATLRRGKELGVFV